jgi:hypothetical protein
MDAKGQIYSVTHIRQTEVEDIFRVFNRQTGEVTYEKFPRTMEQTCENVLSYYE